MVVNLKLSEYVQDNLSKGFDRKAIIEKLKKAGYNDKQIEEAFKSIEPKKKDSLWKIILILLALAIVVFCLVFVISKPAPKCQSDIIVCTEDASLNKLRPGILDKVIGEKYCIQNTNFSEYFSALKEGKCLLLLDVTPLGDRSSYLIFSNDLGNGFYIAFNPNDTVLRDRINSNIVKITDTQ